MWKSGVKNDTRWLVWTVGGLKGHGKVRVWDGLRKFSFPRPIEPPTPEIETELAARQWLIDKCCFADGI